MKRNLFEIYLTTEQVTGQEWLSFFNKISKINGLFKSWNLWINIENNYIRYFVETKRILPTIIGDEGSFLIKKTEMKLKEKSALSMPYILRANDKNILDVYDKLEAQKNQKLKNVRITFYPYKRNNYLSTTKLYLKTENDKIVRKKTFFNFSIFDFVSVDFKIHTRFFYKKEQARYLETKKTINLLNGDIRKALLKVDVFPYLQEELYLKHTDYDFARHSVVIGASGTGKSKMVSSLIKNLSNDSYNKNNYKIVVIDPHSAIEDDIGGLLNTSVIDFKTQEDSINLFINNSKDILSNTESIISILKNIISDRYNSKLERILRYSIHLLLAQGQFDLVNLRKLLTEIEYRNKMLREAQSDIPVNITEFFRVDFNELKTKAYQEAIAPIIAFIDEMQLLPAFNNNAKLKNIKDEIENNFITIISLDQITLGLNITKTIAGFTMQSILQLVQSHTFDKHIILVIDEVAIIENPIINRFLSEARKYNLSLILAGQYFEQISSDLQKAIFTNVVNFFIFRISRVDAMLLENNIKMEVAVKNTHINRIKILTELEDRECIARIGKNGILYPAVKGKTIDFIATPRIKKDITNTDKKRQSNNNINNDKNRQTNKDIPQLNQLQETKKAFSIDTKNTLTDIMHKQSSSRKTVNMESN